MLWVYRTKASIIPWKQNPFSVFLDMAVFRLVVPLLPTLAATVFICWVSQGLVIIALPGLVMSELEETSVTGYSKKHPRFPGHRIQPAGSETYFGDMSLWQKTTTCDVCHLLHFHLLSSRLLALLTALTVLP